MILVVYWLVIDHVTDDEILSTETITEAAVNPTSSMIRPVQQQTITVTVQVSVTTVTVTPQSSCSCSDQQQTSSSSSSDSDTVTICVPVVVVFGVIILIVVAVIGILILRTIKNKNYALSYDKTTPGGTVLVENDLYGLVLCIVS